MAVLTRLLLIGLVGCGLFVLVAGPASGGRTMVITAAAVDATAELTDVRTEDGKLSVTFVGRDLPAGSVLDAKGVRVELDGRSVPATAAVADSEPQQPVGATIVVLDTSGSMAGAPLDGARAAVAAYLAALPANVPAGLVTFASTPVLAVPPTTDRGQLSAALAQVKPGGTSVLHDAVALAARTSGVRRLLVLSDGEDSGSATSLDDAVRLLTATGVQADVVALDLAAGATQAGRDRLARGSGGGVLAARDAGSAAAVFAQPVTRKLTVTAEVPGELAGLDVRLTVRVPSAGADLVAEAKSVRIAGLRGEVATGWPAWSLWLVLGVVFVILCGLIWSLTGRRGLLLPRRLTEVRAYRMRAAPQSLPRKALSVRPLLAVSERVVSARGGRERIELDLDLAGIKMTPAEWLLLRAGLAAGLGVVLAAVTGAPVVFLVGALLGWFGGRTFLKMRIGMRRTRFGTQLPDTLQLVAGALRSGFSLSQALGSVVREGTQPIAGEMARGLARTKLGVSVEDALDSIAERMQCKDLEWVVMAIRIQREVGGNLAELLLTTVHTMRERATVRRQVKALTAEGRLSAYVLIALPLGLGSWMFMSRREYIKPLYTTPIGLAMLGSAAVCVVVGWFWMSRMIKVEV